MLDWLKNLLLKRGYFPAAFAGGLASGVLAADYYFSGEVGLLFSITRMAIGFGVGSSAALYMARKDTHWWINHTKILHSSIDKLLEALSERDKVIAELTEKTQQENHNG